MRFESSNRPLWVESAASLIQAKWFKSTRSPSQDTCVEIAWLGAEHVGVRDSKNPTGPALVFGGPVWDSFLGDVQAGKFDR